MQDLVTAVGGIGVFLLGMVVMTDGLQGRWPGRSINALAGGSHAQPLRAAPPPVRNRHRDPAILQRDHRRRGGLRRRRAYSTFSQSLGIIFGANLGTTITGWMVALARFQVKTRQRPAATDLRRCHAANLCFGGRIAQIGFAIAGFGLDVPRHRPAASRRRPTTAIYST